MVMVVVLNVQSGVGSDAAVRRVSDVTSVGIDGAVVERRRVKGEQEFGGAGQRSSRRS